SFMSGKIGAEIPGFEASFVQTSQRNENGGNYPAWPSKAERAEQKGTHLAEQDDCNGLPMGEQISSRMPSAKMHSCRTVSLRPLGWLAIPAMTAQLRKQLWLQRSRVA